MIVAPHMHARLYLCFSRRRNGPSNLDQHALAALGCLSGLISRRDAAIAMAIAIATSLHSDVFSGHKRGLSLAHGPIDAIPHIWSTRVRTRRLLVHWLLKGKCPTSWHAQRFMQQPQLDIEAHHEVRAVDCSA